MTTQELEAIWEDYEQLESLQEFRRVHPPLLDLLDLIEDCGNFDCPDVGFNPGEVQWHHAFWERYEALAGELGVRR